MNSSRHLLFFTFLLLGSFFLGVGTPLSARAEDEEKTEPSAQVEKFHIYTSPVAWGTMRANLGVQFPLTYSLFGSSIGFALGLKGTYSKSAYTDYPGIESSSSSPNRTHGFEVGPQFSFSKPSFGNISWINKYELRASMYFTQTSNLPDTSGSQSFGNTSYPFSASDSIKGVSYELMAFAHVPLWRRISLNCGAGLISEPHHYDKTFTTDNPNKTDLHENKYESSLNIEFDLERGF